MPTSISIVIELNLMAWNINLRLGQDGIHRWIIDNGETTAVRRVQLLSWHYFFVPAPATLLWNWPVIRQVDMEVEIPTVNCPWSPIFQHGNLFKMANKMEIK
jgi:hypothetical protein